MRIDIEKYLQELPDQGELVYCPNGGNAGDSMIACATFQLFEELKLPFEMHAEKSFRPEGKILIYGGGGNLIPKYKTARQFIERHHKAVKKFVILPHTVSGHEDLLAQLGNNVDVITREPVSYEHVKHCAPNANVFLADDLALRLNSAQILSADSGFTSLLMNRNLSVKRTLKIYAALMRAAVKRTGRTGEHRILNCFRTDKEQTGIRLPAGNLDISKIFKYGTETAEQSFCSTHMLFKFISHYDEVRTNRLHAAIAAALLGKPVQFYPNSYYKCEAVYDFSMKDRFPGVQWMGENTQDPVIEKATEADRPAILRLLEQANMHYIPSAEMPSVSWENYAVARMNGRVIGFCGYKILSGTEAKTELMVVDKQCRRRGLGLKLKTSRLQEMAGRGIRTVITNSDRPESIAWYKKHFGYEEIGHLNKEHEFGCPDIDRWTTLRIDLQQWSGRVSDERSGKR